MSSKCSKIKLNLLLIDTAQILYKWFTIGQSFSLDNFEELEKILMRLLGGGGGGGVTVSLLVAFIKWLCKFNDMLCVLSKLCPMFVTQMHYNSGLAWVEQKLIFCFQPAVCYCFHESVQ